MLGPSTEEIALLTFCGLGVTQANNLISQGPELAVPLRSESTQTWTITTYIDADTRISRGDGGSVFIFTKQ